MTSHTITIPAREVCPGDVLFGMTVEGSYDTGSVWASRAILLEGDPHKPIWMHHSRLVTVERPVPSDPIDTVRVWLHDDSGALIALHRKVGPNAWRVDGSAGLVEDAYVADFPILWKPGMPIPTEGVQA